MEYLGVIVAAIASYAFGAAWYMILSDQWLQAAGLKKDEVDRKNIKPFVISFIATILVAGMMRHVFVMADIATASKGLWAGFGLGAFIAAPWIITNYAFANRPVNLSIIDGVHAIAGCTIMGLVLTLL